MDNLPHALSQFLPFLVVIVIVYVMLLKPQQKKAQEQQKMRENLKKGDWVVTNGGMMGCVEQSNAQETWIRLSENLVIPIKTTSILEMTPPPTFDGKKIKRSKGESAENDKNDKSMS